jgi:hypothetical protein
MIERAGRKDVSLTVTANRVVGHVRGTPVDLTIEPSQINGHIGIELINLWMIGDSAQGRIANRDVGFSARLTRRGHILRGTLPGHTVRLELGPNVLSWLPGCDRDLPAVAPGLYEGECDGEGWARVTVPPAFAKMPVLPRSIVLAMLLTERDPRFEYDGRGLFPPER